jgi:phage-related protein
MEITATGEVTFALNGSDILSIDFGDTSQTIIIDCQEMNAYNSEKVLLNRLVTGNYDNIKLNKGSNAIGLTGNVTAFTIKYYSRWI